MKKSYVILSGILLLLFLVVIKSEIISAQDEGPNLPFTPDNIDKIENFPDAAKSRWEYLQLEWRNILLKNKIVSAIDSFFTRINIVFKIFFNMDWKFPSLLLFTVLILWTFFLLNFSYIIENFSSFSTGVAYAISFILVIIITHLNFISKSATFFINIIFSEKIGFVWLRTIIYILFLAVLVFLSSAMEKYKKYTKEMKEKAKTESSKREIETTATVAKEINRALR
jgi:hypothetical protein